jgi:hypothetical protein
MLIGDSNIACSFLLVAVNFSNKNDFIAVYLIDRKSIQLVEDRHIEGAFGWMRVRVVDGVAEDFLIEGVVESREEFPVKSLDDLGFDVGRVNALESSVKHLLEDSKVVFVVRVHSFETESIDDFELIISVGSGKCPCEMSIIVDNQVLLIS